MTNFNHEPYTDVVQIRRKTGVPCYNVGNGGYHAHCPDEYLVVEDAQESFAFGLELLAVCFLGSCVLCLQFYAAMAAGHGFANHKKLWTVVLFFALWFVMWWAVAGIASLFDFMGWDYMLAQLTDSWDVNATMHFSMVISAVMEVLYGSVAYVITVLCLKRRLNLE